MNPIFILILLTCISGLHGEQCTAFAQGPFYTKPSCEMKKELANLIANRRWFESERRQPNPPTVIQIVSECRPIVRYTDIETLKERRDENLMDKPKGTMPSPSEKDARGGGRRSSLHPTKAERTGRLGDRGTGSYMEVYLHGPRFDLFRRLGIELPN